MIRGTSAMDHPVPAHRAGARRWALGAGLVAALGASGALLYPTVSRWMSADRSVDRARVRIAQVTRGDLQRDVGVQGRIVAAYHPTVFSPASGIVRLEVQAGETVEEGTVLARVDSPEMANRLEQERSTLRSLESDLEARRIEARKKVLADRQAVDLAALELGAAERAMARAERIRAEGILNEVELETAEDDLRRAQLELEHARETANLEKETLEVEIRNQEIRVERQGLVVEEVQRQVHELQVRAPVAGLVSRLDVNDHDAVTPGQPLIGVVDLSRFEVEILVPEGYADEISAGTEAVIEYDGSEYEGAVRAISPEVEGNQVRGHVAFAGPVPEGLRQNQRVSTRMILERRPGVLKVARGPFLDNGGGREAYRLEGGLAVLRPIQVGASSVAEVEVLEGLDEGDQIIVSDTSRFEGAERIYLRD